MQITNTPSIAAIGGDASGHLVTICVTRSGVLDTGRDRERQAALDPALDPALEAALEADLDPAPQISSNCPVSRMTGSNRPAQDSIS